MKRLLLLLLAAFAIANVAAPVAQAATPHHKVKASYTGIVTPECDVTFNGDNGKKLCVEGSNPDCSLGGWTPFAHGLGSDANLFIIRDALISCDQQQKKKKLRLGNSTLYRYTCVRKPLDEGVRADGTQVWVWWCDDQTKIGVSEIDRCGYGNYNDNDTCRPIGGAMGYDSVSLRAIYDVSDNPSYCFAWQQHLYGSVTDWGETVEDTFDRVVTPAYLYGKDQNHPGGVCDGLLYF